MNTEIKKQSSLSARTSFASACKTVLKGISKAKSAVLAEFRGRVQEHEHLLNLALNEAEALALESGFPQLIFPVLATEKAQAVAAWHSRQRSLHERAENWRIAA